MKFADEINGDLNGRSVGYFTLAQAFTLVLSAITSASIKLNAIELTRRQTKQAIRAATTR